MPSVNKIKSTKFACKNFVLPSAGRSFNMSRIRAKNTKAEIVFRKALWQANIRFRLHSKKIIGKPDIFIAKYRLVIFIDGDFWHGYNWLENKVRIKSNKEFWHAKIERNMERDIEVNQNLNDRGFTVMRFWEHEIFKTPDICINQVLLYLESFKNGGIPEKN